MPVPEMSQRWERDLLRDRAYAAIRDAIVGGMLEPGERIRDQELCTWLGLSRTPVRDALARLEQDGLVETAPQRFTRVTPLDRRAIRDTFPLVAALHALAAELGTPHLNGAHVEVMRDANERFERALQANDVDAALQADDDFHDVLLRASGNGQLQPALDRLMGRIRRLERLRFGSLPGRASVKQHNEIVAAAAAKDPNRTAELVKTNWLSLGTLIDRSFE